MKTLYRIPQKAVLAGVLAGFSEYLAIDATLVRLLFIFFVLATGFFPGVVAYVVAIFIMPIEHIVVHEVKNEEQSGGQ